ncbi:hypothetical protein [Rhizobium tumorigenes]|uniref:hypothetical protein n=1 Tax=Rhizobium tumorigenes TaxID=2041385 RepID=UPI00241F9610|nr:hypothetical protein [Rhizobium tumorigenes]WFS02544.1 hypothetical protein PR016_08060 [Rhizobium tumorigenes]
MVDTIKLGQYEHEGASLDRIHAGSNYRKALAYWLGFLKGILASSKVELPNTIR